MATSNPPRTDRDALEQLMSKTQLLLEQHLRLQGEHEVLVQRARQTAEQVVRLQGEVEALKMERKELTAALTKHQASEQSVESHSTYSQPDPTSAALPKEVINEIVQEIDACIALLQR